MPLNLYRRHMDGGKCSQGYRPNTQTYESDELRRTWKKCTCPIYASGRLGENPKFRKNTRCHTWAEARALAQSWEGTGSPGEPPVFTPPRGNPPRETTIAEAATACLKDYETNDAAISTVERYQRVLRRITEFAAETKGYVYLSEWTPQDTRELRASFGISPASSRSYLATVKSFFEFCVENQWLAVNPARIRTRRRLRADREAAEQKEKSPFTNRELERMLTACSRYEPRKSPHGNWTGGDLEDFLLVSIYTGLRISDVATFHISRLSAAGDVHVRAIKNGGWVDTWVPDFIQERIRFRARVHGDYIFRSPQAPRLLRHLTASWRVRLNTLWCLCGPWEEAPTPHRLRHTFVRILLESGVPPSRVAELIGDTEAMVRKHYAKWVPERQQALRNVLQEAFARPEPRLLRVK